MAYERKDMTGSAFKNDKKTQPNHSDWNGTFVMDGKEYWLNIWNRKKASNGEPYLSVSIKAKQPKPQAPDDEFLGGGGSRAPLSDEIDDKIPF